MLTIGICDDEKQYRDQIIEYCDKFFLKYPMEHKYATFSSGEEVIDFLGERITLLFLDIEMNGLSGIDILNALNDNENVWRIVIVTSHIECQSETIGLKTLSFVVKPLPESIVFKCLQTAISENSENIKLSFKGMNGPIIYLIEDIIFVTAEGHYVRLWTNNGHILVYESLMECKKKFKNTAMLQIHRSYLVNLTHVKRVVSSSVYLSNGEKLPVGRSYAKNVHESYLSFIRKISDRRFEISSSL